MQYLTCTEAVKKINVRYSFLVLCLESFKLFETVLEVRLIQRQNTDNESKYLETYNVNIIKSQYLTQYFKQ